VEKVDSIGFVVRRKWIQCSAGKSSKVNSTSRSLVISLHGFGMVGEIVGEALRGGQRVGAGLCVVDRRERTSGGLVKPFGQRGEAVRYLVHQAALLAGGGEHVAQRRPESERSFADRDDGGGQSAVA
jgi:hypothetical protein